jgi:hypothetical protein
MQARKQARPIEYDIADDDAMYDTRLPTSTRRYKPSSSVQTSHSKNGSRTLQPVRQDTLEDADIQQGVLIQRRRSSLNQHYTHGIASDAVAPSRGAGTHAPHSYAHAEKNGHAIPGMKLVGRFPFAALLIGMVITALLLISISALTSWWKTYQDDLHYGRPRTSQIDAVVGHGDSSANPTHFILINLNRHIEVIEIPGGDASHTHIFAGPTLYGVGQDLTPVTGEIRDVNGDKKPDLIVYLQNQQFVLLNDGTTFHPR